MNYEMLREIARGHKRSLGFVVFLAVLNLALALYLSLWQRPELARTQNEWFAKREALKSGQSAAVVTSYDNALRELSAFRQRLIPKRDFARFLSELNDMAKSNSLALKSIGYKPSLINDEGLVAYSLSFTVVGRYASVKSFIADFERMKQMATLDAVSLNNTSTTEESVNLKVQITVYLKTEGA